MVILTQMLYYSTLVLVFSLILLPLHKLVKLYMFAASAVLLLLANFLSGRFVLEESTIGESSGGGGAGAGVSTFPLNVETLRRVAFYIVVQCTIVTAVTHLLGIEQHVKAKVVLLAYAVPPLAQLMRVPTSELQTIHQASATFVLLLAILFLLNRVPLVVDAAKEAVQRASLEIQFYGWIRFLVAAWIRMLLPLQFLIFWTIVFAVQLSRYLQSDDHPVWKEGWPVVLLASASESCSTPLSFVGACVTVYYLSRSVLAAAGAYLRGGFRSDDDANTTTIHGFTEGISMFVLGIQTGLVELRSADRVLLLSIVFFIVLSSLVQSLFEIADPVLVSLAASQSKNVAKHVRAVTLSTFLSISPICMTVWICRLFDVDFWLLVVISSCILTSLQVVGSLFIYALLIFDAIRKSPSEGLDDVIYHTKYLMRILEFFVAVFVVGYSVERSFVGNWNWLNASIIIIHCYFNVWQRLQSGWSAYLQRRDAIKKLERMRAASATELDEHDDVCAVCLQEMRSARITPCRHFFHAICLKKWLFIQDYCPICHQKILFVSIYDQEKNAGETNSSSSSSSIPVDADTPSGEIVAAAAAGEPALQMEVLSGDVADDLISTLGQDLFSAAGLEDDDRVTVAALRSSPRNKIVPSNAMEPIAVAACIAAHGVDFKKQKIRCKEL